MYLEMFSIYPWGISGSLKHLLAMSLNPHFVEVLEKQVPLYSYSLNHTKILHMCFV